MESYPLSNEKQNKMTMYASGISVYMLLHKEIGFELLWQQSKNSTIILFFNDEIKRFYLFGVCKDVIRLRTGKLAAKLFSVTWNKCLMGYFGNTSVNLVHDCKQLHTCAPSEDQVGHRIKKMMVVTA